MLQPKIAIYSLLSATIVMSACSTNATGIPQSNAFGSGVVAKTPQVIPDSRIDVIIDPSLAPREREIMHNALLAVPPSMRSHGAILRSLDGRFHATSRGLLAFEVEQQRIHEAIPVNVPLLMMRQKGFTRLPRWHSAQCETLVVTTPDHFAVSTSAAPVTPSKTSLLSVTCAGYRTI